MKARFLMLVIVGFLADTAVFGVQGIQIHILNQQQTQITQTDQKARCWAKVLDRAITPDHKNSPAKEHAELLHQADKCRALP